MHDYENYKQEIADILVSHESMPGNLLPILHAIQDSLGYIPEKSVPDIACALNQSIAEIHGVISFYHYFRQTPPGKNTIRICRAESCQAMQGKALEEYVQKQLNIDWHETTSDGQFSLEPFYCLGNCACSPAVSINNEVYGRVTPARFDAVIASYREGAE
ncbi:MAG: formate dehydrogenase subunit gamma [Methyloprofundus sp.]|nr:formate dehydrogenase subunit gamma [Methyloprofundus sp.]MDT8424688.1 formate dehydrogenase subunit gamma [Methyloprofundus sp.]